MVALIIVRHGNTFKKGEEPRRIGRRTDLPLVERQRSKGAARIIGQLPFSICRIITAPLRRTVETATIIKEELQCDCSLERDERLLEIDYGPDENKREDEVVMRLGQPTLDRWNRLAQPPPGWQVDVDQRRCDWDAIGAEAATLPSGCATLVVSSNGFIRFAPNLLDDEEAFRRELPLKVATGSVSCFIRATESDDWRCSFWGRK